jgi:hypothetical protein
LITGVLQIPDYHSTTCFAQYGDHWICNLGITNWDAGLINGGIPFNIDFRHQYVDNFRLLISNIKYHLMIFPG